MKNTFHLRSYEPYGKKRLQRYTASSFPNRIIYFLILFLLTGTPAGCIESLQSDSHKISANSHFFFLCTSFLYYCSLDLIFALHSSLIFSLLHVLIRTSQLPIHINAYAKWGPFIPFDRISTSQTINHFDLVLMKNLFPLRNQSKSHIAID